MRNRASVRGVFRVPFVSETGFRLFVAVASDGRRVFEREVWPHEDEGDVLLEAWSRLNELDPIEQAA